MNRPKHDDFDSFLTETFQELAQSIVPPSSTAMWDKLQQLSNSDLPSNESQTLDEETAKPIAVKENENERNDKAKDKARPARTWKKYIFRAGLAAACILFVIAFTTSSVNIGPFFQANEIPAPAKHVFVDQAADFAREPEREISVALSLGEAQYNTAYPVEEGSQTKTEQAESGDPYAVAGAGVLNPAVPETDLIIPWDNIEYYTDNSVRFSTPPAEDRGNSVFMMASLEGNHPFRSPGVLSWLDESSFFIALNELSKTNNDIYYFPELPDSYTFRLGNITSNNRVLQEIYQEFAGEKGLITFIQRFFTEEADALDIIETVKTTDTLYRFNSLSGYIATHSPETTNLTWKEGSSIMEISGDLGDALLEEFLNHMAKINY